MPDAEATLMAAHASRCDRPWWERVDGEPTPFDEDRPTLAFRNFRCCAAPAGRPRRRYDRRGATAINVRFHKELRCPCCLP